MSQLQKPQVQHQSSSQRKHFFSSAQNHTVKEWIHVVQKCCISWAVGCAAGVINNHALFMFTRRRDTLAVNSQQVTRTRPRLMEQLCPLV